MVLVGTTMVLALVGMVVTFALAGMPGCVVMLSCVTTLLNDCL